jgi:hypothetical protein
VAVPSTFIVPATASDPNGYDTGTAANNSITLTASGSWCYANASCFGPAGDAPLGTAGYLEPTAHKGALVGRLGTSGSWEEIGAGPETLNGTGELYLAINDQTGGYGDNSGSLAVNVVANLQFISLYGAAIPDILTGQTITWQGTVNNHGDTALTNVTLFASAAQGLPTGRTDVPVVSVTGSNTTTQCTLQTAGTTNYSCVIPSIPAGGSAIVSAHVFAQALAPQTLTDLVAVGISDQTGGCFGFCPVHVPVGPTTSQLLDGLQYNFTAPPTVAAGDAFAISGHLTNTSPPLHYTISSITTFGSVDKGAVTSAPGCAITNNTPAGTGGSFQCAIGALTAGNSTSDGSIDVDTTGLAGQTIHYSLFSTSPDIGGSSQVVTGSVFVGATAGGIAISTPANGANLAATLANDFTAVPSPSAGDNVTSVDLTLDPIRRSMWRRPARTRRPSRPTRSRPVRTRSRPSCTRTTAVPTRPRWSPFTSRPLRLPRSLHPRASTPATRSPPLRPSPRRPRRARPPRSRRSCGNSTVPRSPRPPRRPTRPS